MLPYVFCHDVTLILRFHIIIDTLRVDIVTYIRCHDYCCLRAFHDIMPCLWRYVDAAYYATPLYARFDYYAISLLFCLCVYLPFFFFACHVADARCLSRLMMPFDTLIRR